MAAREVDSLEPLQIAFDEFEANDYDSTKSPVIFLHGLTASKENWFDIPQIIAAKTKRKVYSLDSRNHGDSEWSELFNFDVNVDDLLNFMDNMDIQKALIVGHSMGGITAIKTSFQAPNRVEKIVVEDMTTNALSGEIMNMIAQYIFLAKSSLQHILLNVDEREAEEFVAKFIYNSYPPEVRKVTKPTFNDRHLVLKKSTNGKYEFKGNMDVLEKEIKNNISGMKEMNGLFEGPACFIYGKISPFLVGEDREHILQRFPNAEIVEIDDASHDVHVAQTHEFTEELINFIIKE